MRLLIAEDDSVTELNLSAAVERFGHEATADGNQACEAFQAGQYSLVISDWDMPAMDGSELCRRIRERPSDHYVQVAERILNLRHHVHRLEGLLPICSYCKRIEEQGKDWQPIEQYVSTRSEAQFSHGICPDCYQKHIQPQLDAL